MANLPDIEMLLEEHELAAGHGGGHGAPQQQQQQQKRTRVLLSCAPCRVSKLKCDREVPCSNCLKKDRADLCEYAPRRQKPAKPAKGMAVRLRRLEGMLRQMMEVDSATEAMSSFGVSSAELEGSGAGAAHAAEAPSLTAALIDAEAEGYDGPGRPIPTSATTAAPAAAETPAQPQQPGRGKGRVVRGQRATTYVGATHFMAMLDDIEDLKAYFEDPEDEALDAGGADASPDLAYGDAPEQLVLGGRQLRSKADLLALLPPRNVTDRLVMRYFASDTPSQHTLHRPSFSRHYAAFWQDPARADADFVAVLFSVIALGVHFSSYSAPHELALDGTGLTPVARYKQYRAAASWALARTRFSSPTLRMLQALLLFTEAEFLVNRANQTSCFLLLAVCIRLMLKMGLHRDPSRLPSISAFEGEIRRRLWNLAIQLDLIVSFYMGLPSMIHGIPSDTSLAHNLLDEDFNEDSPVLPPPRPDTEYTVMSYPIFKSMVCRTFGQVARLAHTLTPPSYAEVRRTHRLLEDRWRQIPAFMKVRPLSACIADPPSQVIQRFGLASLYQKSRCVLHRPYLVEAVPRPEHAFSRRTCLQSALALLAYHEAIHEATQPGGLLFQTGWFVTGQGMHDFLLAAMIVYLVVQNDNLFEPDLLRNSLESSKAAGTTSTTGTTGIMDRGTPLAAAGSSGAPTESSTSTQSAYASGSSTASAPVDDFDTAIALPADRSRLVELLRQSYAIWVDVAEKKKELTKAADLLAVMLRKIYARELREGGSPPGWSPPPKHHHNRQEEDAPPRPPPPQPAQQQPPPPPPPQQQQWRPYATPRGGSSDGMPALSEETLRSLGIHEPSASLGLSGVLASATAAEAPSAQMGFSRRDLVPPPQLPAGRMPQDMAAPTQYDSWMPLSLDALDWGTVDMGIRASSAEETEWATDIAVLNDINYATSGLWDQSPDGGAGGSSELQ